MIGGANPVKINSVVTPVSDFRWDQTWTLAYMDPNGTLTFIDSEIALGELNIVISGWTKDQLWKTLQNAYTEFDTELTITTGQSAGQNHKIVFSRCKANTYTPQSNAGQAQYAPETINCKVLGGATVVTT